MNQGSLLVPLLLGGALLSGCAPKPPVGPKVIQADFDSGPDAKRSGALPMPLNTAVTDNVSFDQGDRTDWKSLDLGGKPGILAVEAHWDTPAADINVDVFDSLGTQIGSSPTASGNPEKKMVVEIEQLGTYFLRVQAAKPKDATDYTLLAKWEVPAESVAPPAGPPSKKDGRKKEAGVASRDKEGHGGAHDKDAHGGAHDGEAGGHEKEPHAAAHDRPKRRGGGGRPEDGVQGRIVSTYTEGAGRVLYIDKGAAAGVAEGQNGWILEGPSGASPLDGGGFTITKVVDDGRCVAKATLKSIGKNTRVSINTSK